MSGRKRFLRAANLTVLSLLVTACAVGPDYVAPTRQAPASFSEAPANTPADGAQARPIDDAWWKILGDPVLEGLLEKALTSAPSIAEAQARVREARALSGVAGADRFPIVDADGQYARQLGSENVPIGVPPGGLGQGEHSNL